MKVLKERICIFKKANGDIRKYCFRNNPPCGDNFFNFAGYNQTNRTLLLNYPAPRFTNYMSAFFKTPDTKTVVVNNFYHFKFVVKLYRYARNDFNLSILHKIFDYYEEGYTGVEALLLGHIHIFHEIYSEMRSKNHFFRYIYTKGYYGPMDIFNFVSTTKIRVLATDKEYLQLLATKKNINKALLINQKDIKWIDIIASFDKNNPKATLKLLSQ